MAQNLDGNSKTITKTPAAIRRMTASGDLLAADCNKIIHCSHATTAIVLNLDGTGYDLDDGWTTTVFWMGVAAVSFTSTGTIVSDGDKFAIDSKGNGAMVTYFKAEDEFLIAGKLA